MSVAKDAHGSLHFLARDPLYLTEKPYTIQFSPHGSVPQNNIKQEIVPNVLLHDIRPVKDALDFDRDGFMIVDLESKLHRDDFADPGKVIEVYLEEVKDMLKQHFGTANIAIIEYLVSRTNTCASLLFIGNLGFVLSNKAAMVCRTALNMSLSLTGPTSTREIPYFYG